MNDGVTPNNDRERTVSVTVHRCDNGHAFFYRPNRCPVCGGNSHETTVDATARLVSHTTVRITPSGSSFRLGLAAIESGAKTLCIIDDDVAVDGGKTIIYLRDDLYHVRRKR